MKYEIYTLLIWREYKNSNDILEASEVAHELTNDYLDQVKRTFIGDLDLDDFLSFVGGQLGELDKYANGNVDDVIDYCLTKLTRPVIETRQFIPEKRI